MNKSLHKKEVFHKDIFSKCDQIRSKLRIWSHNGKLHFLSSEWLEIFERYTEGWGAEDRLIEWFSSHSYDVTGDLRQREMGIFHVSQQSQT